VRSAIAFALALALALAVACGGGDDGLPTAAVAVTNDAGGRAELTVELATTPAARGSGLMGREELAEDRGMLFAFPADTETGFWMKDTSIPLSIAFIAADGTILDVQDMEPLSTELHRSPEPYRYALEVNQGWFGRNGFGAGDRVEVPEGVSEAMEGE
jgi:hypothetical protein